MSLTLRSIKGSALTHEEMDNNLLSLSTRMPIGSKKEFSCIGKFGDSFDVTKYFTNFPIVVTGLLRLPSYPLAYSVFEDHIYNEELGSSSASLRTENLTIGSPNPTYYKPDNSNLVYMSFAGNPEVNIEILISTYSIHDAFIGNADILPVALPVAP